MFEGQYHASEVKIFDEKTFFVMEKSGKPVTARAAK